MKTYELNRNIIIFGTLVGVLVVGFNLSLSFRSFTSGKDTDGFNYEMARSKDYTPEFSLEGRDVEYDQQIVWEDSEEFDGSQANNGHKSNGNKATVNGKNKADAGKKVAKSKSKDAAKKSKQLTVETTDTSRQTTAMHGSDDQDMDRSSDEEKMNYLTQIKKEEAKKKKSLAVDNKDADLPDLSFQQWRNLLNAEPTAKNAYDFAKVFKNGQIEPKDFYSLASEFVLDSNENKQNLGVYFYSLEHSLFNFSSLVQVIFSAQSKVQGKALSGLNSQWTSYLDAKYFTVLNQAMVSTDTTTSAAAIKLVQQAITKAFATTEDNNSTSNSNNNVANVTTARIQRMAAAEANNINKKSILVFESTLKTLANMAGGHYQQTAQNLLQYILQAKS